jgi:hypothetical protein
MNTMKSLILVLLFCFPQHSTAQEVDLENSNQNFTKSCFCETGNWPANQKKLFQIGCKVWLARQSGCAAKEIVDEDTNYLRKALPAQTDLLSVGYVGHWDNSKHFVDYLTRSILPVMRERNLSAEIDNTACDAMHDPEQVFNLLKSLELPQTKFLTAKGNQAISVGTWDVILPSSDNFVAEVSSKVDHIIFPSCRDYHHYSCLKDIQTHETGRCLDQQQHLDKLECCPVYRNDVGQQSQDTGAMPYYQWEHPQDCLRN